MGDFALDERLVLDELGKDGGRQRLARGTAVSATCFSVAYGKDMVTRDRMTGWGDVKTWTRGRFRYVTEKRDDTIGFGSKIASKESKNRQGVTSSYTVLRYPFLSPLGVVADGTALDSIMAVADCLN